MEEDQKIKVGITQGDVNGIGLEVILKAFAEPEAYESYIPIIYGSPKAAAYHRKSLNLQNFSLNNIREASEAHPKRVNIVTTGDDNIHVETGKPSTATGEAAVEALKAAADELLKGNIDVLVTAPVNNSTIQSDNFNFVGQTAYLKSLANDKDALILMVSERLKVGIVANHLPIKDVPRYITKERILAKLRILNETLKNDFTIRRPRIAVLGLNPHAGDNGLLGEEEQTTIVPALEIAESEGIYAMGPYSADSLFGSGTAFKFDAVLAMYHDQGIAPFKSIAFEEGAVFTAGLPFIRTAPIHGTAYDIVGQDKSTCDSFRSAVNLAIDICRNRRMNKELQSNPMQTRANNETERNA